jgi:tetratricopeptide (TPR) repeat protein
MAAALLVLTLLLFAPACANGFVNYDDPDYVTANPHVQAGLTAGGIRWALTAEAASNWHPITWMSHMLDATLFGTSAAGHHATSVLLHALNAALAFVVLHQLTGAFWRSALAAAVFAVHPLRVESVAWVAERKDVLSGFLFFVCLWAYAMYASQRRRGHFRPLAYVACVVAFALGLLAKPMLVTLPFVLLLLDYWPLQRFKAEALGRSARSLIVEKLPLFALTIASCVITYLAQRQGGAVSVELPVSARLANAIVGVARYLGLFAWPSNLSALYPHPGHWPAAVVFLAAVLALALSGLAWSQRNHRPWVLVGWLWFVGMLLPVLGVVQVGLQSIADRYTYLPALGLELAVLWTAGPWIGRAKTRIVTVIAVLGAAATLTLAQIGVWKNSLVLFNHTIAVAGDGNYLAYDNRGLAWDEIGEPEKAKADYERALEINPSHAEANNNLGRMLAARGQLSEAIAHYRTAVAASPDKREVHNNLANALADAGLVDEAITHYRYVLDREPNHVNALNGLAGAFAAKGQLADAEKQLRRVLELDPNNASATSNLGNLYGMLGRYAEARATFETSLARNPDDARTLYNLGVVLLQTHQDAAAVEKLTRAIQLAPLNPDAHTLLGGTLLRLGQRTEAIAHLKTALQQRPNSPQAQAWLQAAEQDTAPAHPQK